MDEACNSYVAQTWSHDRSWLETENIMIEFHNQDIVATIWLNATQDSTHQYFVLGGGESTYASIRASIHPWSRLWMGREKIPGHEWDEVKCEGRPSKEACPCVGQDCDASSMVNVGPSVPVPYEHATAILLAHSEDRV